MIQQGVTDENLILAVLINVASHGIVPAVALVMPDRLKIPGVRPDIVVAIFDQYVLIPAGTGEIAKIERITTDAVILVFRHSGSLMRRSHGRGRLVLQLSRRAVHNMYAEIFAE